MDPKRTNPTSSLTSEKEDAQRAKRAIQCSHSRPDPTNSAHTAQLRTPLTQRSDQPSSRPSEATQDPKSANTSNEQRPTDTG